MILALQSIMWHQSGLALSSSASVINNSRVPSVIEQKLFVIVMRVSGLGAVYIRMNIY